MEGRKSTRERAIAMVCGSGRMAVLLMGLVCPSIPGVGVGGESPETTAELARSAPSVVVLPPRVNAAAAPQVLAAAELACDRLAREITAAGLASVVDRQQVDRLLRERELAEGQPEPMLSFDVMLRLEVDAAALAHTARLSFIDLSHGNPLSEAEYDWPLREADLTAMVEQCREAFKQVGQPKDGKLRVRCFDVENPQRNPRIVPLVARLGQVFGEAVSRSPGLVRVRHLEAASAKEESLLLLLGLSRLPGGRQFVPQADATIELKLREGDGRGKTFEETPVEITVHVTRADAEDGQSLLIGGTVGEFDAAAARAWEKLAEILREAQPAAAADWLIEMAARRRQAEAELRAVGEIDRQDPLNRDPQKRLVRLDHAETALKLDPTCEDAWLQYMRALAHIYHPPIDLLQDNAAMDRDNDIGERMLAHALRYFEQFGPEAAHRHPIHESCRGVILVSLEALDFSDRRHLTPQRRRMVQKTKLILEDSVKHRCHSPSSDYQAIMLAIVARAMAHMGVPIDERWQWVDSILAQCAQIESEDLNAFGRDIRAVHPTCQDSRRFHSTYRAHNELWLVGAILAVENGGMDRAKRLIAELRDRLGAGLERPYARIFLGIRGLLETMDDAGAVAEFNHWMEKSLAAEVRLLSIDFPPIKVFGHETGTGRDTLYSTGAPVPATVIRHPPPPGSPLTTMVALVEGDGRLYMTMSGRTPQVLAYVSLDPAGRPVGEPHRNDRTGQERWEGLMLLPPPAVAGPLQVLDARYLAGRLCLGTRSDGLLIFDPTSESWSSIGLQDGLPDAEVPTIYTLDEWTLFCVGRSLYTVDIPDGTVMLRHGVGNPPLEGRPRLLWRDGGALRAWGDRGLYVDLCAPDIEYVRRDSGAPYGWGPAGQNVASDPAGFISAAAVDGRRFATNAGLHEFDAKGNIVRSWWGPSRLPNIVVPPDCPIQSYYMVAAGDLLVFVRDRSVLAWEPKTDTWYGPSHCPLVFSWTLDILGTRAGVWLGTGNGLVFISNDDLIGTAKSVGRALTTDQYRERQREVVAAMPPLNRAKVAYSMARFEKAKELASAILSEDPQCAEALLLLGHLHELRGMNQPQVALEYYRRLAEVTTDPNASFTGMYRRLGMLRSQRRWPEAMATVEEIAAAFPRLHNESQRDIDWLRDHVQRQLLKRHGEPPAAGTANTK